MLQPMHEDVLGAAGLSLAMKEPLGLFVCERPLYLTDIFKFGKRLTTMHVFSGSHHVFDVTRLRTNCREFNRHGASIAELQGL